MELLTLLPLLKVLPYLMQSERARLLVEPYLSIWRRFFYSSTLLNAIHQEKNKLSGKWRRSYVSSLRTTCRPFKDLKTLGTGQSSKRNMKCLMEKNSLSEMKDLDLPNIFLSHSRWMERRFFPSKIWYCNQSRRAIMILYLIFIKTSFSLEVIQCSRVSEIESIGRSRKEPLKILDLTLLPAQTDNMLSGGVVLL